ncbi:hypothetical protein BS50DRAFT_589691 [Corynespora cassiicola Philippines]|uniref:F-box domain-containing protein n=1 Tax=Corynespora cassiicola Philippines TaxID=1448308 RepID=A0A2T2NIP5_CORCC|nr:hypothetical protein BS50DRAFT_589691 [Corynespora cassiicola Philippines]
MSAAPAFNETGSKLNLADLVSSRYVPIQDAILDNPSLKDMANLSSVCRQTSSLNRYSAPRWQWEKFLGMWFDDARSFRSLQARLNIILSGHVLIDFLTEKPDFMAADPELKLGTHKQYYPELKTFLENCGYTEVSR